MLCHGHVLPHGLVQARLPLRLFVAGCAEYELRSGYACLSPPRANDAGCTPNGSATLWRIQGGTHFVNLSDLGRERIIQFLVDHSSTARCLADLDASDRVDAADLGLLIAVWNTNDAQADLDGSGTVDSADLGLLIAAWGLCP